MKIIGSYFGRFAVALAFVGLAVLSSARATSHAGLAATEDIATIVGRLNNTLDDYLKVNDTLQGAADSCPNAPWKKWRLHVTPPEYDPLNWRQQEWNDYLVDYPLRSSALSLSFLLLGAFALLAALMWRCVQWCVSCGHCRHTCSVGVEKTTFLGDTKHAYLKFWIYVLLALGAAMVIWGMLALDKGLMSSFWDGVSSVLDRGNNITQGLHKVQAFAKKAPPKLQSLLVTVQHTMEPDTLLSLAQDGLGSVLNNKPAVIGLLNSTSSMREGLDGSVLPGMEELAVQLGASVGSWTGLGARGRRQLADDSYDKLWDLFPGLSAGLPLMAEVVTTRQGILQELEALQVALGLVRPDTVAVPQVNAPALVALSSGLRDITLAEWDVAVGRLVTALQVYNSSKSGKIFTTVAEACNRIMAGVVPLSPPEITRMVDGAGRLDEVLQGAPQSALQALTSRLRNISDNVVDISGWRLQLPDGSTLQVLELTERLLAALQDATVTFDQMTMATTSTTATFSGGTSPTASWFIQVTINATHLVDSLSASTAKLAADATAAAATIAAGPDPTAAITQVTTALRPALRAMSSPIVVLSATLDRYQRNPTQANLDQLFATVSDTILSLSLAIARFTEPLADEAALMATASGLQRVLATVGSEGSALNSTLAETYSALSKMRSGALVAYEASLNKLESLLQQLPGTLEVVDRLVDEAQELTDEVTRLGRDVLGEVEDAVQRLEEAVATLQEDVLQPGNDFKSDNEDLTKKAADITYPVWMSLWGLCGLLFLLLAVAVWTHWPGGLVLVGLLLLALLTASQAVTSAISFGIAVLEDGCDHTEAVAMRELDEHHEHRLSVVLSYYVYRVPRTQEEMLQAAFGLNVSDVLQQLQSANGTLVQRIKAGYPVTGATLRLLNQLEDIVGSMLASFNEALQMMSYDNLHKPYVDAKATVCCDAGNMAFTQWCAITAMASLSFGALVAAAYLLARMDMVGQRRQGCCSCCTCDCYRPHDPLRADLEATGAAKMRRHGRVSGRYQQHWKDKDNDRHQPKVRSAKWSQVFNMDSFFAVQAAEAGDPVVGAVLAPSPKAARNAAPPPSPAFMVK